MNIQHWDMDSKNDRVVAYLPQLSEKEIEKIDATIRERNPGKFIVYTTVGQINKLNHHGFELEAEMSGFFSGQKALIFTKYLKEDRKISSTAKENRDVLSIVNRDEGLKSTPPSFEVSVVTDNELPELAKLFSTVFEKYPTNIFDVEYLKKAKENEYLFIVAKDKGKIVGAASAMDTGYHSAEITDCAVNPHYRGKHILHIIVQALEKELPKKGIHHVFSITRAKSVGMNMTVKRLGYKYEGTLTNNCIISTGFEDMNVWTKKL
ncbi:putative beta-lysine N-acetyltransferase [Bacillus shivajii]|uniref:putative beta-lysine N-acetyltransferase n=1 Tax=Bacillus shivajii TaxID=1983719 RepID=UPI001CFBF007|nr:putative beta-lysine N-acetyltransferase [Bacillus shivajii]UCZ54884.1 putative beta-lysine N-acetyltransferase [Bacillus shivajii]